MRVLDLTAVIIQAVMVKAIIEVIGDAAGEDGEDMKIHTKNNK